MLKINTKQVYTSVACNRTPEIVDWNKAGVICYGACNAIVIYDTKIIYKDPITVLNHHNARVNSVKWLTRPDGSCTEMISASADKTAAIWTLVKGDWKVTSVLAGHEDGVTCIFGMYTGGNDLFVFTASVDSTVKVWERSNDTVFLKQTIHLNSGLCLTLHAQMLPIVSKPVLFLGLDDNKVHVFALNGEYHRVDTLLGHEDWVRGLDTVMDDNTILLASCSQDTYIRVWRIQRFDDEPCSSTGIKVERKVFEAYDILWSVKLEAVLAGHEGWVYGVQWDVFSEKDNKQPLHRILSSSLDKTIILWEPELGGAWVEKIRVGEVGGNGLGFYGSRFGPTGFLGHGYNGSLHLWTLDKELQTCVPSVVLGGHFGAVEDMKWEPKGRYVLSVSLDQTARIHAPWKKNMYGAYQWHEIARPQVHGYDMCSVSMISPTEYASAAEEKVVRVFKAPANFIQNFQNITGEELEGDTQGPEGASVPSLGLSNKAVFSGDDMADADADKDGYFVPMEMHEPPTEETLMQNTLWPEANKLYGHGYEVYCVEASPDGQLLATACKATTVEHASVLIWDTKTWNQTHKLVSHQLTVTQIAFSPNSKFVVTVSRDRKWTLYQRDIETNSIEAVAGTDKSNGVHTRIIWCCAWFYDGTGFATGSRDGKVCLWSKTDTQTDTSLRNYALVSKLELQSSVTALAFGPLPGVFAAIGLETGVILLYTFKDTWSLLLEMDRNAAHHLAVKRLAFKPKLDKDRKHELILASCGADNFVRVNSIIAKTV
ncbi:probable elongator complex protein 2 isoform X1 [Colias croceus]|uniref:probable elongator complex protein 2 isoform X1 n=1 Tax=Colias crocea TaxID=72248 RepID=UPI001E27CC66|nr:probable elongator complex protein 2 isoform X1 [Colias croceus]